MRLFTWFSAKREPKPTPLNQAELIYLENELLRIEGCLRSEIKELWRAFNDQQSKTLKLEKARTMKFLPQEEVKEESILEKYRRRKSENGNKKP